MVSVLTSEPLQRLNPNVFKPSSTATIRTTQETSNGRFATKFRERRTFYESFLFSQNLFWFWTLCDLSSAPGQDVFYFSLRQISHLINRSP